jgi:hypothetical protein
MLVAPVRLGGNFISTGRESLVLMMACVGEISIEKRRSTSSVVRGMVIEPTPLLSRDTMRFLSSICASTAESSETDNAVAPEFDTGRLFLSPVFKSKLVG